MKGIADSGFVLAFGNRDDRYHAWAAEVAKTVTEPLLTCEAVLAEAAFQLKIYLSRFVAFAGRIAPGGI